MLTRREKSHSAEICAHSEVEKEILILVGTRTLIMQQLNNKTSTEVHCTVQGVSETSLINYGPILLSVTK